MMVACLSKRSSARLALRAMSGESALAQPSSFGWLREHLRAKPGASLRTQRQRLEDVPG